MGTVYAVWDTNSGTSTDVSSPDLNGSTANLVWKFGVSGGIARLEAAISGGTWDILVATRVVF